MRRVRVAWPLIVCVLSACSGGDGQLADETVLDMAEDVDLANPAATVAEGAEFAAGGARSSHASFLPGWSESEPRGLFTSNDLYGHINGGAEVFKEFGFLELSVRSFARGRGDARRELTLEVYRMDGPLGALGIYLAQTREEKPVDGLSPRHSWNPYQLLMLKGDCFIQINSFSGDEALLPFVLALARKAAREIPEGSEPRPFDSLPTENLIPGSRGLARGPLALEPLFTLGRGNLLGLGGDVFAVYARYRQPSVDTYLRLRLDYPIASDAMHAMRRLAGEHDRYLELLENAGDGAAPDWLLFRDYRGLYLCATRRHAGLELLVNLSARPARPSLGEYPLPVQ